MNRKYVNWIVGVPLALAALVAAYSAGRSRNVSPLADNTQSELEELRSSQSDAAVVKRVSQQMEDIAYQQKAVSDQERDHARRQSELALQMRDRAEQESRLAREAEQRANAAAVEAEQQREAAMSHQKMAEQQRDQANYAKSVTDTLNYRTLGRTLGSSSSTQYEGGNMEIAVKLAYTSWYLLENFGGNTYYTETFNALNYASGTSSSVSVRKGGAVRAMTSLAGGGCVAVTDYGEIELFRDGQERNVLLQNEDYDFRDVLADESGIWALSFHGPLCRVGFDGKVREIQLPPGDYLKLKDAGDGQMLIAAKSHLLRFNIAAGIVVWRTDFDSDLLSLTDYAHGTCLFFADGKACSLESDGTLVRTDINAGRPITAAGYCDRLKALILGCDNGDVLIVNTDNRIVSTMLGHNGRVTGMTVAGDVMVTSSYDRNVLIWNMPFFKISDTESLSDALGIPASELGGGRYGIMKEWLNPVPLKFDSWPLSVCLFGENEIAVGTADGQIVRYNVSASDMARRLRERYDVVLSSEEWDHYIGNSVPYIKNLF